MIAMNYTLTGTRELVAAFEDMPEAAVAILATKVEAWTLRLQAYVQGQKLTGQVLNVITGNLRASIHEAEVENSGMRYARAVYSDGSVKYARIHEFGGVIDHPGGTPYIIMGGAFRSNRSASFFGDSATAVFISKANAEGLNLPVTQPHQIVMPERSFLRSGLGDMQADITTGLKLAAVEAIRRLAEGARP
jgi:phage gpG-like protein